MCIRDSFATVLQLLDMNDAELTWMTNHMGHTKDVRMNWYRKEDSTLELTKVAKVLHAVDRGDDLKNKKIDDLEVEERMDKQISEEDERMEENKEIFGGKPKGLLKLYFTS